MCSRLILNERSCETLLCGFIFFIFSMIFHCVSIHYWRLPGLVLSPSTGRYDGPASTYVRLLRFSRFFFSFFRTWNLQLSNSRYPEPYFGSREMTAWADEIISHLLLADDWSAWLGVSWHMMYVTVLNRPVALINRSAIKFSYIVCGVARYKARDALKVSEFKTAWYFCTRNWVCSM